ncbi:hypothetical protein F5B18DRAFT_64643 [Nemania serpens]|nr:hypothetical protein F5B18DRAFT_64643 [Nemania serpens]
MHLFRRRLGARTVSEPPAASLTLRNNEAKAGKKGSEDNPPPSYEDSQDASLRAVLHGAEEIVPLLWPSALPPSPPLTPPLSLSLRADGYRDMSPNGSLMPGKNREKAENARARVEETTITDVLASLATTPCGEHPFLSRIREFSDFYFAPYVVADETPAIPEPRRTSAGSTSPTRGPLSSPQDQQRKALESIPASRESVALVLCARVLETYYASLGHTALDPEGNLARKTRLTQLAACAEPGCACGDYDEAATSAPLPSPLSETQTAKVCAGADVNIKINIPSPRHCACGHAQPSHPASSAAAGVARLLRHYTNWRGESYASLGHRSSSGRAKRRIREIEVCGAPCAPLCPCPCPCRDYDKGRRTGRCARCGHYGEAHVPIHVARGRGRGDGGLSERGRTGDAPNDASMTTGAAGPGQREAEWELSWVLIENAYLLLGHITASLHGEKLSVVSSSS